MPQCRKGSKVPFNRQLDPISFNGACLQLSVFLPNYLSLDEWYAEVYASEASMLGDDYLRKVVGYDFHLLRKKYDVQSMWGRP